ncbi:transforming protein Qin/forkhead transcription factor Sep1 [Blumeria hordei DH14]|uniref:Transforming protein Qin/forkhead transcription factor Sep1 n=1 Tax=Blumeria graminis f. sp. hordei (strain DH14) TaxID=546991 RepID=N1JPK7_BLUG1|nr:transforming protein Qin/forkhead transcription factor Sep1 [Blumeria hordei DH14]
MSSVRRRSPLLQIYQDSYPLNQAVTTDARERAPPSLPPLRPMKNASSRTNTFLGQPQLPQPIKQSSPQKSLRRLARSPAALFSNSKLNTVSMPPPSNSNELATDSMIKKQPPKSKFKPRKVLFTTSDSNPGNMKDNQIHLQTSKFTSSQEVSSLYHGSPTCLEGPLEGLNSSSNVMPKRLLDAAPIHDSRPVKKVKREEVECENCEPAEIPSPNSFPPIFDDGAKPPHSYAQLIGMSLLRAPTRRLTLAQIYKWVSDTYRFYTPTDAGWQNSIRHNLSLNKAFIKQERPKDDPGKDIPAGKWNALGAAEQLPSLTTKPMYSSTKGHLHTSSTPLTSSMSCPNYADILSSDATIPESDADIPDVLERESRYQGLSSPIQSSPLSVTMHSSPPIPCQKLDNTPAAASSITSSRVRSRQGKLQSANDSGYYSSLDSSAIRSVRRKLHSDVENPRLKRGRAEEEIARLRGPSSESPIRDRHNYMQLSSPVRRCTKSDVSSMLPPLTPAVRLRAPIRPPPSASPNTNLRLHRDRVREMVGSPLRGMTILEDGFPWSPAFHFEEQSHTPMNHSDSGTNCDIFHNSSGLLAISCNGSPEIRASKRQRYESSNSGYVEKNSTNSIDLASRSHSPKVTINFPQIGEVNKLDSSRIRLDISPLRNTSYNLSSPSKSNGRYLPTLSVNLFNLPRASENQSENDAGEEWDIMKGFQKIGTGRSSSKLSSKDKPIVKNQNYKRNLTTRF